MPTHDVADERQSKTGACPGSRSLVIPAVVGLEDFFRRICRQARSRIADFDYSLVVGLMTRDVNVRAWCILGGIR